MKVKLTNNDAQRLLAALRAVDAESKLEGRTRLDIAININRLMPMVMAFETTVQKRRMDFGLGSGEVNKDIVIELSDLMTGCEEYDLKEITVNSLKLDDNLKITGDQLASMTPILTGLE